MRPTDLDPDPRSWLPPEFDDAILGVADVYMRGMLPVYDHDRIIEIIMRRGLSHEDAENRFVYDILAVCLEHPMAMPLFVMRPRSPRQAPPRPTVPDVPPAPIT